MTKAPSSQCRGGLGSIPGQGTSPHMPQRGVPMPQLKISCAATKVEDPAWLQLRPGTAR